MNDDKNITISITSGAIVKTLAILALAFLAYFLRDIVLVVLASIIIASAIEPGVRWFEDRKLPRIVGVITVYILVLAIVLLFILSIIPTFLNETSTVISNIPTYLSQLSAYIPLLDQSVFQGYIPLLQNIAEKISSSNVAPAISTLNTSGDFLSIVSEFIRQGVNIILIVVLAFYFSVTPNGVTHFLRIVTPVAHEKYVISLWERTKSKIGAWMQGQLLLGVIVGFLVYVPLLILGIKHALLLAIMAAILELIPVFGPTLSAVPAVALTILDKGIGLGMVVLGVYIIVQQFENHLLYPAVVKKIVGISPLIVILALVIGGKLAGFLGILLSVPMSVIVVEYLDDIDKGKFSKNS